MEGRYFAPTENVTGPLPSKGRDFPSFAPFMISAGLFITGWETERGGETDLLVQAREAWVLNDYLRFGSWRIKSILLIP